MSKTVDFVERPDIGITAYTPRILSATATEKLVDGVFYISNDFTESGHLCPCGCGDTVHLNFVGDDSHDLTVFNRMVTIYPAIYRKDCKVHYSIENNKVVHCPDCFNSIEKN